MRQNMINLRDFNYVTDKIDRDNQESKYDRKSTIQKWKVFQATHDLKDTFRDKQPDLRRYTYTHKNKKGRSRLDRIYVTENLFLKVKIPSLMKQTRETTQWLKQIFKKM